MAKKKITLPKLPRGEGSMNWDTKNPELIVYRKSHTFSNGKSARIGVTGYTPTECIANMKEKIRITEEEIRKEKNIKSDAKNITLAEGMRIWLINEKHNKIKEKTYDRYECTLENQIAKKSIGMIQVYSIDKNNVESYLDELYSSNLSKSSIKKAYELLKQYMDYLYEKNPIDNPMRGITLENKLKNASVDLSKSINDDDIEEIHISSLKQVTEKDVLNDEEIKAFKKEACKELKVGISGYRYGYIFYFMILTFPRIGEMLAIRWKDIDFENKMMFIRKGISTVKDRSENAERKRKRIITTPKSQKSIREVMLTDEAIWALKEHKKRMNPESDNEFICKTIHGTVASDRVMYDSLKLIIQRSGISNKEQFSPHNLRHTGISYYIRHGVPIEMVANMAGHDISVTQHVYYHIIQEQKNKALDIMNSISID